MNQLQHGLHRAGPVDQLKLHQRDTLVGIAVLQIADALQLARGFLDLLGFTLYLDKEHMDIDGFVVADAGDVHAQRRNLPAGQQKGADVIVHVGDISLFHAVPSA